MEKETKSILVGAIAGVVVFALFYAFTALSSQQAAPMQGRLEFTKGNAYELTSRQKFIKALNEAWGNRNKIK